MCESFVSGELTTAVDKLSSIMNLTMYPWGNAYYNTSACGHPGGYDRGATLTCWRAKCGPKAASPPSDCFTAAQLCQHEYRTPECEANRREGCAVHYYPDPTKWLPWVRCYEGNGDLSAANAQTCAKQTGLDFDKIEACQTGILGKQLDNTNAKATLAYAGQWQGTPTVTVGDEENPSDLISAICSAYTGTKPAGCSRQLFE